MPNKNIIQADRMIGTPQVDSAFFPGQQSYPDTCAIRCQEFVLEQFLGIDIPEDQMVQEAESNGWYTPGEGTSLEDVGKILELHGLEINRYENANVYNLVDELAQGHKVIVGVDSGELWEGSSLIEGAEDILNIPGADHAVTVLGIDTSDSNNVQVIIADPGTGEASARYPMDQFVDAWKDSSFYMVATAEAAPAWNEGMENFDYEQGYVSQLGSMTYEEVERNAANQDDDSTDDMSDDNDAINDMDDDYENDSTNDMDDDYENDSTDNMDDDYENELTDDIDDELTDNDADYNYNYRLDNAEEDISEALIHPMNDHEDIDARDDSDYDYDLEY